MKKSRVIPALILLVILAAGATAIPGFFFKDEIKQKVTGYEIIGANLLTADDYIRFSEAHPEKGDYPDINVLYDRMLNHPYIKNVEMQFVSGGKVKVNIVEKEIIASVYIGDKLTLLSKELEVLPVMKELRKFDYPVIRNTNMKSARYFKVFQDSTILPGYKIAKACRLIGGDIASNLSEIDLRKGGDIILIFSDMKPPVICSRKGIAEQILVLGKVREMRKEIALDKEVEYIDLRYSGKIYLGGKKKMEKRDEKRDNNRA
jgi:cell division septal protein FtsQ